MTHKIVAMSDTHGYHEQVKVPDGTILIHAGDFTGRDHTPVALRKFLCWFSLLPHKHKILVAGNHDFVFERSYAVCQSILKDFPDITYLQDDSVSIDGIHIHGSPVSPEFLNWAFNRARGEEINRHWDLIPSYTDILVTHGPAKGLLDVTNTMERVGDEGLLDALKRISPKYHLFGHIHFSYGTTTLKTDKGMVTAKNCSICGEDYKPTRPPHEFYYDTVSASS